MYSAPLGQFLSRDPLAEPGAADVLYDNNAFGVWLTTMRNQYGYVSGNPTNWVDPSGLKLVIAGNATFVSTVGDQLRSLCSTVLIDKMGVVSMAAGPYQKHEQEACCCIRDIVANAFDNFIVEIPPGAWTNVEYADEKGFALPGPAGQMVSNLGTGTRMKYDPNKVVNERPNVNAPWRRVPNDIILAHEICGHVLQYNLGMQVRAGGPEKNGVPSQEIKAVDVEDKIRAERGLPPRPAYGDPALIQY